VRHGIERDVQVRGVFQCGSGKNIRGVLDVAEVRGRNHDAAEIQRFVANSYRNHALRVRNTGGMKEDAVDGGKNRGVRADSQRQCEHGHQREAGILAQHAPSKRKILHGILEQRPTATVAITFLGLLHAAKFHQRIAPRLFRGHSRA